MAAVEFRQINHVSPIWDIAGAAAFSETAGAFDETLDEYNIRAVFLNFDDAYLKFLEPTDSGT